MKTLNTKLIVPLFITLVLTGCMPDSLTKFKKDPPKKSEAATTTTPTDDTSTPVTDDSGAVVPFTAPTYFRIGNADGNELAYSSTSGTAIPAINIAIDGSVGEPSSKFLLGCSLVTTGNSQTTTLPSGLTLNTATCTITGTPTASKAVTTAFCSNPSFVDQTSCESVLQVWDSSTQKCSNMDYEYRTEAACTSVTNRWYPAASVVPYRIELRYKDSSGTVYKIYSTVHIGTYQPINPIKYSQADKLLIPVTATSTVLNAIVPVRTTTAMTGSYAAGNMISAQSGTQGVANYVDTAQNTIGVKKLIKLYVSNGAAFSVGGFLTTAVGSGPKVAKIFKKDSSNANILYVENISGDEIYFKVGDLIDPGATFVAPAAASVTYIDESPTFEFSSPNLDNDRQYYSNRLAIKEAPANSYLVNSVSDIKPLQPTVPVTLNNGTVFTVSPKLPLGITMDPATGKISGRFAKAVPATDYVIKATNPLGSVSTTIKIIASEGPKDLALTNKQIITVSNTAFFTEGERLFQQISPPLSSAPFGRILKIINSYQMAIEAQNGAFREDASLDSGNAFYSEKAYIIPDNSCVDTDYLTQADCEANGYVWSDGFVDYNLALKFDGAPSDFNTGSCSDSHWTTKSTCEEERTWDAANLVCSDPYYTNQTDCETAYIWGASYITSTLGAKATISAIDSSSNTLFVKHITQAATSVSSAKTFNDGDTLVGSSRLISEVNSDFLKLGLTSAGAFTVGKDVTGYASGASRNGGYIYAKSGSVISVSDITHAPNSESFKTGDTIYANEFSSGSNTTISSVTHAIQLVAERGVKFYVNTSISTGNVIYSITPALPAGLTLNSQTGEISGTPTTLTPSKDFILSATNFIGQSSYVFSLEVRDYFTLSDASGAPSFLLHKVGDTQTSRKCRINATDILNGVTGLDVRCYLEAEEEDLNFNAIKFKVESGAGVCQYIQYAPYHFWQYSPVQSAGTSALYASPTTVIQGCDAAGAPPTKDLCDGNYERLNVDPGDANPNCDEGYLNYTLVTQTGTSGACTVASTETKRVECGGSKTKCLTGPIKDELTDKQISDGYRSTIAQSPNGYSRTITLSSPNSKGDMTNLRVANSTKANLCSASNTDVNTWSTRAVSTAATAAPFGDTLPYYTFNCLNAASQIKARIRLIVRDWDRSFKINNGVDLVDPSTTVTGVGSDIYGNYMDNAGTDLFGYVYNKYKDLDDTGAAYSGGSCGVIGAGAQYPFIQDDI